MVLYENIEWEGQGSLVIDVKDTGPGISQENQKKLFKPFQQADSTIYNKYGGTGLGLWISRTIITQMGGDIQL